MTDAQLFGPLVKYVTRRTFRCSVCQQQVDAGTREQAIARMLAHTLRCHVGSKS